jgi:hypothetical protein
MFICTFPIATSKFTIPFWFVFDCDTLGSRCLPGFIVVGADADSLSMTLVLSGPGVSYFYLGYISFLFFTH